MKRSANGCAIIPSANLLSFIQQGQQSQMQHVLVNFCQHSGHFFLDISGSEKKDKENPLLKKMFKFLIADKLNVFMQMVLQILIFCLELANTNSLY